MLLNLDEEEERDKHAVTIFMKKYAKLWRYLFSRYANSGHSTKHPRNFNELKEKTDTINIAELAKMLKDHDVNKHMFSKEDLAQLVRLVNFNIIKRHDLTAIDYNGFQTFIMQFAYVMYQRLPVLKHKYALKGPSMVEKNHMIPDIDVAELPPVESIKALKTHFEKATKARGHTTILYDDPDSTSIGDPKLLKALNKKLEENPEYPVPEGFSKVVEKDLVYRYEVPEFLPMPENQRFCVEFLDELVHEIIGVHFLEPLVTYEESTKVRPRIRKEN